MAHQGCQRGHDHDHGHNHSDKQSWTDKNRAHWDKVASTYNSVHTQKEFGDLINKLNAFVLQNINWIGVPFLDPSSNFESQSLTSPSSPIRILDYACGPGTITAALAGYATEYVGIDISENMVKEYNNRFQPMSTDTEGTSVPAMNLNASAVVGDLLDANGTPTSLDDSKYFNFDLAVVSGGFHHFEDVELATKRLVERLKPGGVLMIFDFLSHSPEDLHDHPALNTISYHGFGEARVRELFGGAGLEDTKVKVMEEKILLRGKAERQGFLARGRKPEA